jgi:hypothetical protein
MPALKNALLSFKKFVDTPCNSLLQCRKSCYNKMFLGDRYVSKTQTFKNGQAESAVL